MIKIERTVPPQNTKMKQKKEQALKSIEQSINQGEKPKIIPLWTKKEDPKVKEFLHKSQYGKCCYCERKKDKKMEMDVEHFRPKAKVEESKNHQGYWWLAYEWCNLLLACKKCNTQKKGTKFPLQDEQKRAFTPQDDLTKEESFLLNPLTENPEDFIQYDIPTNNKKPLMIKAIGKDKRGNKTINELTGINDQEVLEARAEHFKNCRNLYELFILCQNDVEKRRERKTEIKEKIHSSSLFSGLARFYFKNVDLSNKAGIK